MPANHRIVRGAVATICAAALSGVMVAPAAALAMSPGTAERGPAAEASSSLSGPALLQEGPTVPAPRSAER